MRPCENFLTLWNGIQNESLKCPLCLRRHQVNLEWATSSRDRTARRHIFISSHFQNLRTSCSNVPRHFFGHIFLAVSNDRPSIYSHLLLNQHTGTRLVVTLGVDRTRRALSAWLAAGCPFVLKHCDEWGSDTLPMPHLLRLWLPDWASECIFMLSLQAFIVSRGGLQRTLHKKGAD